MPAPATMKQDAPLPSKFTDLSAELYLEAKRQPEDDLELQSRRVRWKLDLIIVPLVSLEFLSSDAC